MLLQWSYMSKDAALRIRVERELHDRFLRTCKQRDLTASQVLRDYMRGFVEIHGAGLQHELKLDTADIRAGQRNPHVTSQGT